MRFEISHTSEYIYSKDVFFEPHYFRFKPKTTPHSFVKHFSISFEPEPSGFSEQIDIENNYLMLCCFDGLHHQLRITANSVVETDEYNPFTFCSSLQFLQMPFAYVKTRQLLKPSLQTAGLSEPMIKYSTKLLNESDKKSIDFLLLLTKEIHRSFILVTRESGNSLEPDITFKRKHGSCRDLSWMQIHMLRNLGIASRFVSGYLYIDSPNPEFELHAWVEAYLPGAGWIGLDPSHGMLTSHFYIPVASSAFHENTMPVSGSVRGSATSTLKNELKISMES